MAFDIIMPAMEMAQDSGTLVQWLRSEGDLVQKGEPLMVIETDKVSVEIEAPDSGVLAHVTAHAGDTVPVGQVIAVLLDQKDLAAQTVKTNEQVVALTTKANSPKATPVARSVAAEHNVDLRAVPTASGRIDKADVLACLQSRSHDSAPRAGKLIPASPRARSLAAARGIRLEEIRGSGERGAVLAVDVLKSFEQPRTSPSRAATEIAPQAEFRVVPITGTRRVIADRMRSSYQSAPHISLTVSADMTEVNRISGCLSSSIEATTGYKLSLTTIIAKLLGSTIVRYPRLNAHVFDGEIHEFRSVHLGIAVAVDDGLIVPVIREIESKGLGAIQSEMSDLIGRARNHTIKLHEIKGSTFTLSNLGMYGIEEFTAILNPPEAGIVSIGIVKDTPIGLAGQIILRPMLKITLSVDHRAIDGAAAATFLHAFQETIENPFLLFG